MSRDPWRYQCPACGSHSVTKRTSSHRPKGKKYSFDGSGTAERAEDDAKRWRCRVCNEWFVRPIDKKAEAAASSS